MRDLPSKALKWFKDLSRSNNNSSDSDSIDLHIIARDEHIISRRNISDAALKVISGLHQSGYQGFLVGGGVRDLLLGGKPKDFDVATDATPEQVRRVFRSARIIGRRFKIVHVRFGREVIEVTTFRGSHEATASNERGQRPQNQQSARSKEGMLLRDNVYGSLEEDAVRRDLTINALYYTTKDFAVYDYTAGLRDLNDKLIRIIGDPTVRYQEDPVRMLRVVRFAAKLGFSIEAATAAPIKQLAPSLGDISSARMFDEVLKLLMSGYGVVTFELMQQYDLFRPLFPQTQRCLDDDSGARALVLQALKNTDDRIHQGKPVTPAFIFAALLWPAVEQRQQQLIKGGLPELPAIHQASQEVAVAQQQHTAVPKRFGMPMREIWELQLRLPKRNGRRAEQLMENRRFRAAYDFLLLREETGTETGGLGQWWTDYQVRSPDQREAMVKSLPSGGGGNRRRPRRSKPSS